MPSIEDELKSQPSATPTDMPLSNQSSLSSSDLAEQQDPEKPDRRSQEERGPEPSALDLEAAVASGEKEAPAPAAPDFGPPPDGGWEAWLVVAGGFCTIFASFGWINCQCDQSFLSERGHQ